MKKALVFIVTIILLFPLLVNASSYGSATSMSRRYINNFLNPDRYIKVTKGDLISKGEVEKTIVRDNLTVSPYMYDGIKFWAKDRYIIGETINEVTSGGDAKTKVTELVLHDTKVKGRGKYNDPWMFVDTYKVTVKSNGNGLIDSVASSTKSVSSFGSISFDLTPDSGYKYLNNTCGVNASVLNNVLTINNVEKDIECNVIFEASLYGNTLPQPMPVVHINLTNSDKTYPFTKANPDIFSSRYLNGYYTDDKLTTRLGKLTSVPYRKGWTFKGYYVGENKIPSQQLVNANGFFETTYSLLKDNNTKEKITYEVEANKYKITFNKEGGEGGTTVVENWPYEHDMPKIELPGRKGYTFVEYYARVNVGGRIIEVPYYNINGQEVKIFESPHEQIAAGDLELHARWKVCPVGSYCPGDNKEYRCPSGYSTETTGSIKCTQCRYWDPCHTGENTCRWGCSTCCSSYSYQCGTSYSCAHSGSLGGMGGCTNLARTPIYCSGTTCSSCNCSSCYYGHNTCKGAWVYIQNENSCVVSSSQYTVNLNKNGGTGGADSYILTYYGTKAVAVIDGNKDKDTISIPTRAGYVFDGYYTSATGGTKIIDRNYVYSASFNKDKTNYTNEEMNNLITEVNGKITVLDLKSKVSPSGSTFTLYAHWTVCPKGSRCPGDNKNWLCGLGQYQDETGKTTCKSCVKESYQWEYGKDKCDACQNGSTNSTNGKKTCDADCPNLTGYVKDWETATWNTNNTVSNACKIKSCATGYHLEGNKCVINKVTIRYKLGSGETLTTPTGSNTWSTDGNGFIYANNVMLTQTVNYESSLGTYGLSDHNNAGYLNITKQGYKGKENAEWSCVSGNCARTTYDQNVAYSANDFCDTSKENCIVVLSVNWVPAAAIQFRYTGSFKYKDGNNGEVSASNTTVSINDPTWQVKFLTSGTLTVSAIGSNIDAFLVGGGGGAGGCDTTRGGGGGGGGFTTTQTNFALGTTDYAVTIGDGGGCGSRGGTSSAFNLSAAGGYAGNAFSGNGAGGAGGSGGGGTFGGNDFPSPEGTGGSNGSSGQDGKTRTNASNGNINRTSSGGTGCSSNGGCKINGQTCYNTRAFCEASGELYAGGGAGSDHEYCGVGGSGGGAGSGQSGWCVCGCRGKAQANKGGGGASGGGSSGIVIIRNHR